MIVGSADAIEGPLSTRPEAQTWRKKVAYIFMGLLAVYSIVRGAVGTAGRPFWFDELLTLTIASQPTFHDMWTVLRRGFDVQPPFFYLVERTALNIPIKQEIALRLPSILAFPCTLICIFAYVKKRSGELIACICALSLLSTSLFERYQAEARPYSLMVACIALSLVCYQRLPSFRWTIFFGLSLLFAELFHYYAFFAMIPFGLSEIAMFRKTGKLRGAVLLAMVCGILPMVACLTLVLKSRAFYGSRPPFADVTLSHLPDFYGSYFLLSGPFGVALAIVAIAAIIWAQVSAKSYPDRQQPGTDGDWTGATLLVALVSLPLIVFVLVRLAPFTLADRYVLAATLGIILGLANVLLFAPLRLVVLVALFVASSVGLREYGFWRNGHHAAGTAVTVSTLGELVRIEAFIERGGHPDLQVVIAPAFVYLQAVHYLPSALTGRAVHLVDEQRELRAEGNDVLLRIMRALQDYMPLRVADYSEFTTAHPEFLLYAEGNDWALVDLSREGASLQLLEIDGTRRLYLVGMHGLTAPTGVYP